MPKHSSWSTKNIASVIISLLLMMSLSVFKLLCFFPVLQVTSFSLQSFLFGYTSSVCASWGCKLVCKNVF